MYVLDKILIFEIFISLLSLIEKIYIIKIDLYYFNIGYILINIIIIYIQILFKEKNQNIIKYILVHSFCLLVVNF